MKHDYAPQNYMIWKVCGIPTPVLKAKLAGSYEGKKLDYPSKSLLSKQGGEPASCAPQLGHELGIF